MNIIRKALARILSKPRYDMKENYKEHRKRLDFLNPRPRLLHNTLDHEIMVDDREIPVRVFFPKKSGASKILIFFHGGGWVTGNIDTYTRTCSYMADETNHIVISVDYRLAPENPFPAGVEDCYSVTKYVFDGLSFLKRDLEDVTLMGDSAGGNLAAVVSMMSRDRGGFIPAKQILIYPATNYDHSDNSPYPSVQEKGYNYIMTSQRIQDYLDLYVVKEEDKLNPYVAPILAEDLSSQPKTLIITAEHDPLRDEGEAYGHKLQKFGNDATIYRVAGALHGFFSTPIVNAHITESYTVINSFLHGDDDETRK